MLKNCFSRVFEHVFYTQHNVFFHQLKAFSFGRSDTPNIPLANHFTAIQIYLMTHLFYQHQETYQDELLLFKLKLNMEIDDFILLIICQL